MKNFWHPRTDDLLIDDQVPYLDGNVKVMFPYKGIVVFGTTKTWPEIFTHEVLKKMQNFMGTVPNREIGHAMEDWEEKHFLSGIKKTFDRKNTAGEYGDRFEEQLFTPDKYSMTWVDSVEPTPEEIEKASYLRITYSQSYTGSSLVEIRYYWIDNRFEIAPVMDNSITPRSYAWLLKTMLEERNKKIDTLVKREDRTRDFP
jgi:hypothetical protein